MEAQIKEEVREASLYFEDSGDNLASLSLVEKYDRFIRSENSDIDSDGDFFPDDTVLREEYAQLTSDAQANNSHDQRHRLSNGLPGKFRKSDINFTSKDSNEVGNGTEENSEASDSGQSQKRESLVDSLDKLIEKLKEVRRCEPEGNSIFCTEEELEAIQERYGAILDLIFERSTTFERKASSKDSDNEEQVDVENAGPVADEKEDCKLLTEKVASVRTARDRFYEVEQQVREQVEQLELVERYKMESVG